ncbi:MAG: STAS domain-containing protein [Planctomycetes bacterium]|nr:STAS domain-containing protein [Planctomycetota bacterium]
MADKTQVDVSTVDGILVVSLRQASIGGVANFEDIAITLRGLLNPSDPQKMVIDFSQVSFFSSQVLGLLVDLWRRLKDAGGALLISGINPQLTRVFRITHLDKIFEFYENTEAAVSALHAL